MLNDKMLQELNKQINEELFSAYLYLSMSAYFSEKNLNGFANWMRVQYQEESFHANKLYDYVINRGGTVVLEAIAKPQTTWKDEVDIFTETLKHEQHITSRINHLVEIAHAEKDHASATFLQWFVNEQVEEEANVNEILGELKLIAGNGYALLMIDRELKQRTFTPPQATNNN